MQCTSGVANAVSADGNGVGGGGVAGAVAGEGGIGLQAAMSGRYMAGEFFWTATIGLSFRIPGTLGIAGGVLIPTNIH